jgi:hypothetical protein
VTPRRAAALRLAASVLARVARARHGRHRRMVPHVAETAEPIRVRLFAYRSLVRPPHAMYASATMGLIASPAGILNCSAVLSATHFGEQGA